MLETLAESPTFSVKLTNYPDGTIFTEAAAIVA
jgi:hypothetical protein